LNKKGRREKLAGEGRGGRSSLNKGEKGGARRRREGGRSSPEKGEKGRSSRRRERRAELTGEGR
jgi:hypothetical protein